MLKIFTNGEAFDLSGSLSLQIDEQSPITSDRGSQTLPVTLPLTDKNARLSGFAHRLDIAEKPMQQSRCIVSDGVYLRTGKINIVSAGRTEGITLNIGFDNSEAYSEWKEKNINALTLPTVGNGDVTQLCQHLEAVMNGEAQPYAVFQIVTGRPSQEENNITTYYPEYLNRIELRDGLYRLVCEARTEQLIVNNTPTAVKLPPGYGVTAFVYVWQVIEFVFAEYGYTVSENPFKDNPELARLVVLNNAADCCVTGQLKYADLMPDCTVEQFLNALYVRFGMVYFASSDTMTVRLKLLRDILKQTPSEDLTADLSSRPLVTFSEAKQLVLSAKTSFEGAAPAAERLEAFLAGDKGEIVAVPKVSEFDVLRNIVFEETTGRLYKWDTENEALAFASTSFFNWDRETPDVTNEELSSDDECVPMLFADNGILSPQYLAGYVHRYSYIKSSASENEEESEQEDTPLAFCFAFMKPDNAAYSFGSVLRNTPTGDPCEVNGVVQSFSLLFQYDDGLFAKFWKDWDAQLRHAAHEVSVTMTKPLHEVLALNMLAPYYLQGQPLLIDSYSYQLPAMRLVECDMKLRTMKLLKPYDLAKEQAIPVLRRELLIWVVKSSTLDIVADDARRELRDRLEAEGYTIKTLELQQVDYVGYLRPSNDPYLVNNPPTEVGQETQRNYSCTLIFFVEVIAPTEENFTERVEVDYAAYLIGKEYGSDVL